MTYLIGIGVLALILSCIYLLSQRVDLGLFSLLAVELYNLTFGLNAQVVGGVHLNPHDTVLICLLAAGVIRTASQLNRLNTTRLLALGFTALLVISVARGLFSIRILSTLNEFRVYTGTMVAMLYFLTAPTDEESVRKYIRLYLYFGAALCVVAFLAALGFPVGGIAWAHSTSEDVNGRYVPATAAAAIAVCGFFSLAKLRYREKGLLNQLLPIIFMSTAIYLRHRTAWMMLIVGTAAILPLDRKFFLRLLPVAAVAGAAVAALAIYGNTARGLPGESNFSKSATDNETWEWRVKGWKELVLDDEQSAGTIAIGKSMGEGFYHYEAEHNTYTDLVPHSEYVQDYLRVGVTGTLLLIIFAIRIIAKLWRLNSVDPGAIYPSSGTWAIVVLITFVYGITYGIEPHSYALIGIAAAMTIRLGQPAEAQLPPELDEQRTEATPSAAD